MSFPKFSYDSQSSSRRYDLVAARMRCDSFQQVAQDGEDAEDVVRPLGVRLVPSRALRAVRGDCPSADTLFYRRPYQHPLKRQ